MEAATTNLIPAGTPRIPNARLWTARVLGTAVLLFLLFDAVAKVSCLPPVIEGTVRVGEPFWMPVAFGVIVWACLYLRDERIRALLPRVRPVR
jgi:hypothetical protein